MNYPRACSTSERCKTTNRRIFIVRLDERTFTSVSGKKQAMGVMTDWVKEAPKTLVKSKT